jgi:hypothetical protein
MKNLQWPAQLLSRKEQASIQGGWFEEGYEVESLAGGTLCCMTPNGHECWSRRKRPSDLDAACDAIYPAYGGSVLGYWMNV